MARLDVHPMPHSRTGYILDVQADLLASLATRAVVPLIPEKSAPMPIRDLKRIFDIDGARYVMVSHAIASIPVRELKRSVGSHVQEHDRVLRALDILLVGI